MTIWKDIKGYEGFYQVSNLGRVKSVRREVNYCIDGLKAKREEKFLTLEMSNCGYLRVRLSINGESKKYSVHRLVATSFIPNSLNLSCVNHKNEDKTDNRVENLEWCTHKYNSNYGTVKERRVKAFMAKNSTCRPVIMMDSNGNEIRRFRSIKDAFKETGINTKGIGCCCQGKKNYKTAGGYKWKYK